MRMPIDIREIMSSGTKLREDRERPVRVAVFVDVEAPEELVEAVREALHPQTGTAMLHVEACAPGEALLGPVQSEAYLFHDPFPVRDGLPLRAGPGPEMADVGEGGGSASSRGFIASWTRSSTTWPWTRSSSTPTVRPGPVRSTRSRPCANTAARPASRPGWWWSA